MAANAIDWDIAQRIGELIAGAGGRAQDGGVLADLRSVESVEPRARDFAGRVSDYTGLALPAELPALEVVDRPAWIAANLKTMRPLLDPLTERMGSDNGGITGLLSGQLRTASGYLLGAQVGALTGVLSQRVLGQYDLSLLDASVTPRLLLVAPNLAQAARNLGVDRDELVLWVTIHEVTHAVQFSGAPWLRDHLGAILKELIDGLQVTIAGRSGTRSETNDRRSSKLPDTGQLRDLLDRARRGELRDLVERARHGELLRLTLGEER
jgi:putative hydrolase